MKMWIETNFFKNGCNTTTAPATNNIDLSASVVAAAYWSLRESMLNAVFDAK